MKKIYLFTLLSFFSLNLFCQIHWVKHPDNPIIVPGTSGEWDANSVAPGAVLFHDNVYHMWYGGGDLEIAQIGHATSIDGINWTKDPNNPVLKKGNAGDWDENNVQQSSVLKMDSVFHMWYTGHGGDDYYANYHIGHATSTDGITWIKDTIHNPALRAGIVGEWDAEWIWGGAVIHDGNKYHTWYSGGGGTSGIQIGHATSPDGIVWTKDPLNPVLSIEPESWEGNRIEVPTVIFDGTSYHMWYSGGKYGFSQIGYATSEDGSIWNKYAMNPVIGKGSFGSWESKWIGTGAVIDSAGVKYKMWYVGGQVEPTGSIGYAESDTRIPYLVQISNKPVYASTDSIVAEIDREGMLYIVPDGTSPIIDSITKYKVASAEALANTEAQISFTEVSTGKYIVLAVSSFGFVCPNPYYINVDENANPPNLQLASNSWSQGNPILAKSDKDGTIYLVLVGTTPENIFIGNGRIKDSIQVNANTQVEFLTNDLYPKDYLVYAKDNYGQFSDASELSLIVEDETAWVLMNSEDPGGWTCIVDTLIYSFGGGSEGGNIGDDVKSYNTVTNEWNELTPIPMPWMEGGIGLIGDKIYLAGGWNRDWGVWAALDSVFEYDLSQDSWTSKSKCPFTIASNAYCVMDNKLYILGGWGKFSQPQVYRAHNAMSYDPANDLWDTQLLPEMNYPHLMHATAEVLDGNIYVLGGAGLPPDNKVQPSEKFDGELWVPIAEMPVPVTLHKSIVHNNKIIVFGGDSLWTQSHGYSTNFIQEYDPSTDTWRIMESMPFQRSGMFGGKVDNYVYLIGGAIDDREPTSYINEVWRFNLDSLKVAKKDPDTGITNTKANQTVLVYPNPANDVLYIKVPAQIQDEFDVKMFNVIGKMIFHKAGYIKQIDISDIPPGVYLINVKSKDFVNTKKIIKQ